MNYGLTAVLSPEAKDELRVLIADPETKAIGLSAVKRIQQLEQDPYLGKSLRYKPNRAPLAEADCRSLAFDLDTHTGPKRHRLVYRLEPDEGSPNNVYIFSIGVKPDVYNEATARAASRKRALRQALQGKPNK